MWHIDQLEYFSQNTHHILISGIILCSGSLIYHKQENQWTRGEGTVYLPVHEPHFFSGRAQFQFLRKYLVGLRKWKGWSKEQEQERMAHQNTVFLGLFVELNECQKLDCRKD